MFTNGGIELNRFLNGRSSQLKLDSIRYCLALHRPYTMINWRQNLLKISYSFEHNVDKYAHFDCVCLMAFNIFQIRAFIMQFFNGFHSFSLQFISFPNEMFIYCNYLVFRSYLALFIAFVFFSLVLLVLFLLCTCA